jgi:hypothetical protein
MGIFDKLIGKNEHLKNMFDAGGYAVFEISGFLYNNNTYLPKSGYKIVFHPAFRAVGTARRPSQLGVPNRWTTYKRNCPVCKKETECFVIGIIFMKDFQTASQNTYLDYCTNCSNVLTLLEIKDNKMENGQALMLLTLEMKTSGISISNWSKAPIKTATEYQKARFEIFLNNFTSHSNNHSKSFPGTLTDRIKEVKKVFYYNME